MTTPYRSLGEITIHKPENTYGLIRKPKPHKCNPPGCVARIFYFIIGMSIPEGSLFRCKHCNVIHRLSKWRSVDCFMEWEGGAKDEYGSEWIKLGGKLQKDT